MSTVSRPHTQQRKVSRRRRVIRRFVALIAVAFVSATVFEGVVLWTHKAFAAPWTSAAAFAEEWADMPHVFQEFGVVAAAGGDAIASAAAFVKRC